MAVKYQSGRVSRPRRRSVSKQPQLLGNTQNDVWLINNTAMGFSVSRQRCQVGRCCRSSATAATATAAAFNPPMLMSRMGKHYRLSLEAKQSEGTRGLPGHARQSQQHRSRNYTAARPLGQAVLPLAGRHTMASIAAFPLPLVSAKSKYCERKLVMETPKLGKNL